MYGKQEIALQFFSHHLLKLVNAILEGCGLLRNEMNRIHFFKEREAQYISMEFPFEFISGEGQCLAQLDVASLTAGTLVKSLEQLSITVVPTLTAWRPGWGWGKENQVM